VTRILVTGGAGFIGSHIVDQLVSRGIDVVVLDNLDPAAHSAHPDYLRNDVVYQWGDIRDIDAWRVALEGVDAVCHQAGKVGLGVDFGDVRDYVDNNDNGLAVGLLALHESGALGASRRFVLASSMVVYGEGRYRCVLHGVVRPGPRSLDRLEAGRFEPTCDVCGEELVAESIPEDALLDPRNVYAATKLHQEHLLAAFAREHDAAAVTLRYHNVYGSRMPRDTPYAGVASIFRSAYEAGMAPLVTEDGRQRRDFVHVSDIAAANVSALLNDVAPGPYNVASGVPHSVGEMAEALGRAFGHAPGDACWPKVTGTFRRGDVRHVFASTDRIAQEFGFRPSLGFDEGMADFAHARLRASVARS
jgi:dTDP-L-rhamnose 4-epimerase